MTDEYDFPSDISYWLLKTLLGDKLGEGATRKVYAVRHDPTLVVKIEDTPSRNADFCNVSEWEMWHEMKDSKWAKYLAPLDGIAGRGTLLLMKRTEPITQEEFEKEVRSLPNFLCDLHWANFGRLDGRIVCHDYGYNLAYHRARQNAVMQRVRKRSASS